MELFSEAVREIRVRHESSTFQGPAMIHVSAVTVNGNAVVVRRIQGDPNSDKPTIGTDRIARKLADAQRIFGGLVGKEIAFMRAAYQSRGERRTYYRINWRRMPKNLQWMLGSWPQLKNRKRRTP